MILKIMKNINRLSKLNKIELNKFKNLKMNLFFEIDKYNSLHKF